MSNSYLTVSGDSKWAVLINWGFYKITQGAVRIPINIAFYNIINYYIILEITNVISAI